MDSNLRYQELPDEKLIELLNQGNNRVMDILLDKYKNMVRRKARAMFLVGGDTDDLIQEGMIGLYKAIRDYDKNREASFRTFANLCVERQIYTAVNNSNRKKHGPLNSYVSIFGTESDSGIYEEYYVDNHSDENRNPEELLIDRENVRHIERALEKSLSKFEWEVIKMYIDGDGYREIARRMDKKPKTIDNALQRIKNKVNGILEEMRCL